jgi:hypothetical protein
MHESEGPSTRAKSFEEEKAAASASFAGWCGANEMQESQILQAFSPWHGAC